MGTENVKRVWQNAFDYHLFIETHFNAPIYHFVLRAFRSRAHTDMQHTHVGEL